MITLTTKTPALHFLYALVMRFADAISAPPDSENLCSRFGRLVSCHDAMIRRICLGYTDTRQDLEDMYQDVLVNIWRGLPSFRAESSERTWIYRIALNTCVSTLRVRKRQPQAASLDEVILVPDQSHEGKEAIKDLYECISTLNPLDRAIMMMWLDECSYDEIADTVGLKRNNIAVRLHRAKERLREKFT